MDHKTDIVLHISFSFFFSFSCSLSLLYCISDILYGFFQINKLYLVYWVRVTEQVVLSIAWSETPKTGLLALKPVVGCSIL